MGLDWCGSAGRLTPWSRTWVWLSLIEWGWPLPNMRRPAGWLPALRMALDSHSWARTSVGPRNIPHWCAALGAKARRCPGNIFTTQDHAAAAIAKAEISATFVWKRETLTGYWWCTEQTHTWPGEGGHDQIVDDGGEATMPTHKGKEFKEQFAKDKTLPDPNSTSNQSSRAFSRPWLITSSRTRPSAS